MDPLFLWVVRVQSPSICSLAWSGPAGSIMRKGPQNHLPLPTLLRQPWPTQPTRAPTPTFCQPQQPPSHLLLCPRLLAPHLLQSLVLRGKGPSSSAQQEHDACRPHMRY